MVEVEYLSIAEFAEKAGVSKQAIYKQVGNENSQIAPYLLRDGKRTLIKVSALRELYKVDTENLTFTTPAEDTEQPEATPKGESVVEETTPPTTLDNPTKQPNNPISTQENQPISTDYIAFLKAQIAELKEEKTQNEKRFTATIQEKDAIIKSQTEQLANLAQQVAQLADKALIATSQQQYLTAMEKAERAEPVAQDEQPVEPAIQEEKKGFWSRLFGLK